MISEKRDSITRGFLPGILLPFIILTFIIAVRKGDNEFLLYLKTMYEMNVLAKVMSICLIPNLLLFFIFIWSNRLGSARGVLLSMFVAGLVIGLLKIF
jgi:hypothetical protein